MALIFPLGFASSFTWILAVALDPESAPQMQRVFLVVGMALAVVWLVGLPFLLLLSRTLWFRYQFEASWRCALAVGAGWPLGILLLGAMLGL